MDFCTDINPANNGGSTPFHSAALQGNYSLCEFLIEKLEDKNPKSIYDHTPLHSAADMGHLDICELIVRNIPKSKLLDELNVKYTLCNTTPLDMARGRNHKDVVEFLEAVQNQNQKDRKRKKISITKNSGHCRCCGEKCQTFLDKNVLKKEL